MMNLFRYFDTDIGLLVIMVMYGPGQVHVGVTPVCVIVVGLLDVKIEYLPNIISML